MKVTVHNGKYNDSIVFDIEELTEESRQDILFQVHAIGWDDKDCWSEVDLKPCPFCGGEAEVTDKDNYGFSNGDWMVFCNECHTYLGFDSQYETPEQAIEAWNRRTE